MDITIENGEVIIDMKDYLKECIQSYGEGINSSAKTPSQKSLLNVDENSAQLSVE